MIMPAGYKYSVCHNLQICVPEDGSWKEVVPDQGDIFVNAGDMLERITGGDIPAVVRWLVYLCEYGSLDTGRYEPYDPQ